MIINTFIFASTIQNTIPWSITKTKKPIKPSNKTTLPLSGEKGEIVFYQPDESIRMEVRLEDETVWLLGTSVKDMGKGLCTIIKLGFNSEEILKRI